MKKNRISKQRLRQVQRRIIKPVAITTSEEWDEYPHIVMLKDDRNQWFEIPKTKFIQHGINKRDIFSNFFLFYIGRARRKKCLRGRLYGIKKLTPVLVLKGWFFEKYREDLKKYLEPKEVES